MIALIGYFFVTELSREVLFFQNSMIVSGFILFLLTGFYIAIADRADEINTSAPEGQEFYESYIKNISNRWALVAFLLGMFGYIGFIPVIILFRKKWC